MPARMSKEARERFLRRRHVAVLVTLGDGGGPVSTPIWYLFRDGVFYLRTSDTAEKTANIRRDPRVSICVQDERAPYKAVVVRGTAVVAPAADWLSRELPRHYLGAIGAIGYRHAARKQIEQGPEITLIVRPERITTSDFSSETPWFGRLWLLLKRALPAWL
jgi:PPOX class probable F420-dependent enzyme